MTPLLQLLKLMSTSDSRYRQRTLIDFLAAVKETMGKSINSSAMFVEILRSK